MSLPSCRISHRTARTSEMAVISESRLARMQAKICRESQVSGQKGAPTVKVKLFPIESFSEEIPKCPSVNCYNNTFILFVIDDCDASKLAALAWRQKEVERWLEDTTDGVPPLLVLVLQHAVPRNDSAGNFRSVVPDATAAWGADGSDDCGLAENQFCVKSFVEALRQIQHAPPGERLHFTCNFDDKESVAQIFMWLVSHVTRSRTEGCYWEDDELSSGARAYCCCTAM